MGKRLTVPALLCALLVLMAGASGLGLVNQYIVSLLCTMGIYIILSASLNLVNGYMGEFSCGHAGFMAVGAYVASIAGVFLFVPHKVFGQPWLLIDATPANTLWAFPLVLALGFAAAAVVGLVVAIPSFKTRGDYLAVITLAAAYMIKSAIENIDAVGGPNGFMGMSKVVQGMDSVVSIPIPQALQSFAASVSGQSLESVPKALHLPWMLIWVFIGVVFTIFILRRFVYSTFGKGIMAIHQDEVAAEIMSVNTNKMKMIAFMLSSGLAGVAGGLFAYQNTFINPGSFNILISTECLVMVYLGGMGSLTGSVISAVAFVILREFLNPLGQLKWVVIPLLLILLMQFRPEGIMGNRELPDFFPKLKRLYRFK